MFDNSKCNQEKEKYCKLPNNCYLMGPTGPTGPLFYSSLYILKLISSFFLDIISI